MWNYLIGSWRFLLGTHKKYRFWHHLHEGDKAKRARDNIKGREYRIASLLPNNIERQNTVNTEEEHIGLGN